MLGTIYRHNNYDKRFRCITEVIKVHLYDHIGEPTDTIPIVYTLTPIKGQKLYLSEGWNKSEDAAEAVSFFANLPITAKDTTEQIEQKFIEWVTEYQDTHPEEFI